MKKSIILLCVLMLLLSACVPSQDETTKPLTDGTGSTQGQTDTPAPPSTDPSTDPTTEPSAEPSTAPSTDPTVDPQLQARIDEMQALLGLNQDEDLVVHENFFNMALIEEYSAPEDVPLNWFFCNGFEDEPEINEEERAFLDSENGDIQRLPIDKMDAALQEVFGLTLEQTNQVGMSSLKYWEETGCYYHPGGMQHGTIKVDHVEDREDGTVAVYYHWVGWDGSGWNDPMDFMGDWVITLKTVENGYHVLSNMKQ